VVLLQDLQNAEMSEAARETSAKGEANANACPAGLGDCTFVQGLARRVTVPRHTNRIAGKTPWSYGPGVPKEQYFCTPMETECESMRESCAVPSY
jgi:hypothetical protein